MGTKLPAQLIEDLLARVQADWYQADRDGFFRDRSELIRWLSYPAWWLENRMGERYAPLPAARYEEIVADLILRPMREHARQAVRYVPKFLGHAVQEHMRHHWEQYAEEVRSVRSLVDKTLTQAGAAPIAKDPTVELLAEMHRKLTVKGGRPAKPKPEKAAKDPKAKPAPKSLEQGLFDM